MEGREGLCRHLTSQQQAEGGYRQHSQGERILDNARSHLCGSLLKAAVIEFNEIMADQSRGVKANCGRVLCPLFRRFRQFLGLPDIYLYRVCLWLTHSEMKLRC